MKRIYADLQKTDDEGRLILTARGTVNDLQKHEIALTENLKLAFWMDDADDAGNSDPLHFEGIVHRDEKAGHWVAEIDWNAIRNASAEARSVLTAA